MIILFLDSEKPVEGIVKKISNHVVELRGVEQNLSGFHILKNNTPYGKYENFTTLYRSFEGGYQLSDDGSVYVEPEPMPEPEPVEPTEQTLEEAKNYKKMELKSAATMKISSGVETDYGTFSYGSDEQVAIRNAYEDSAASNHAVFLSDVNGTEVQVEPDQVSAVYTALEENKIDNEAKLVQLMNVVDEAEDKETVEAVSFEDDLTGDHLEKYNERKESGREVLKNSMLMSSAMRTQVKASAVNNTDEQALAVKSLYKNWSDDPEGYQYSTENPEDKRRNFGTGLWNLNKSHKKQADWYPGADPTLWTEVVEGHDGTLEDPIPVPDSVTVSGFEYIYGKYYLDGSTTYLCKRGGIPDEQAEAMYGKVEKLYYKPSSMVGQYFVVAE